MWHFAFHDVRSTWILRLISNDERPPQAKCFSAGTRLDMVFRTVCSSDPKFKKPKVELAAGFERYRGQARLHEAVHREITSCWKMPCWAIFFCLRGGHVRCLALTEEG